MVVVVSKKNVDVVAEPTYPSTFNKEDFLMNSRNLILGYIFGKV